jgi:hypothetical protein
VTIVSKQPPEKQFEVQAISQRELCYLREDGHENSPNNIKSPMTDFIDSWFFIMAPKITKIKAVMK